LKYFERLVQNFNFKFGKELKLYKIDTKKVKLRHWMTKVDLNRKKLKRQNYSQHRKFIFKGHYRLIQIGQGIPHSITKQLYSRTNIFFKISNFHQSGNNQIYNVLI